MKMYTKKIKINYNKQKIKYTKEVRLPYGLLTIADISKHLKKDEKFKFFTKDCGSFYPDDIYLKIVGYRLETETEYKRRIKKDEKYMDNYKIFHKKYDKKYK